MSEFFIVIPTHNSADYLERCLASILLTQPGSHRVHVHVQDNSSTDDTRKIAEAWAARGVTFSSENDRGIYDAINRAAKSIRTRQIMTWLGSDDMLLPGTLATVASIFNELPNVEWLTGLPFIGRDDKGNFTPWGQQKFTRKNLSAGLHDGRRKNFIMQEGTFWRSELWLDSGGLNPEFRLAGDWDLWRRFARTAALYTVDFSLARFTQREGQASADLEGYYKEVDAANREEAVKDRKFYRLMRSPQDGSWKVKSETLRFFAKSHPHEKRFSNILNKLWPRA
ncbi:MAG: glycosyltransferase [Methylovirgula sp.]|uniref:glycosyltransferase n=1 Tax=Methylovirgula sp. TaxID=1978224 RepID=UPI0030764D43